MQSEGDIRKHTRAASEGSDQWVFSGMQFRDFGNDNCFRIEDSNFYKKSLQHMGYKTVEFVTYKRENGNGNGDGSLYFVEAKTSLRPMSNEPRAVDEIREFRLWKFAIKVLSEKMAIEEKLVVSGEV